MPMRSSSLANNPLAITRELDGRYDVVLQVRDNLDLIEQVAGIDFAIILAELESAQDFTGITVVQGEAVAWDAVNKILTVPKGDKGDKGDTGLTGSQGSQGIQGPQGIKGDTGPKGDTGSQGPKGFTGDNGAQGPKGDTGNDLTISQITYNGNGTFNWLFSDGTVYVTPSLKGPKGDTGNQGVKGDQGISVHHIKGTSTTDAEGDFGAYGEIDTYTVYGDANETINLGFFRVNNGATKEGQHGLMYKSTYDITANGIVDNSEKLEGRTIAQIQADITDTIGASNGIASLDATTKLERAQVPTMNVTLEGDVSGSFAVDGSLNTTVNVVVQDNSHSHTFSNLTANPTTLSGYGITDADTSAQVSAKISTAVAALVDSSPATLDTLNELAAALGDDHNFATTTSTAIGTKVTKNADITAGTATKVTYDAKGLVTSGTTLSASDIPVLDASKITTGLMTISRGGTGVGTSTGTGDNVLNTSPTLVTPALGIATGTSFNSITGLSNTAALAAGIAAIGTDTLVARQDHVHPIQTTISGNAGTATKLATARNIALTGDITGNVNFDGTANVSIATTIAANSIALGTDTTGNYVVGNTAGTGIVVTGTAGEGWSPTIALSNVGTAGTYRSVTVDVKGRVTAGTNPTTLNEYGITDAYDKTIIDTLLQGFKPKAEVKVATTTNITLSGTQIIDDITVMVGDRVLVKNQTTTSENGIYVVSATAWSRATDSDTAAELIGSYCFISQGSTQADTGWYMNIDSVTLGTTGIVWIQFTGTGAFASITHVGSTGASHGVATTSVNGFMSSTDKNKLDASTSSNTVNTVVMRDSSGNFTAGIISGTSFNSITGLSSTTPVMDGTATAGTGVTVARADHVHPKDTTKVDANANITAGTYKSVTVDVKGLVTGGTNPTTIGGYGITDAYTKTELDAVNVLRADKFLAAQNIAAMVYTAGDLTKIQYNNATNVNYEVLNYTSGNLSSINHYTTSVLRGTTTLSYSGGNLVSAIFA